MTNFKKPKSERCFTTQNDFLSANYSEKTISNLEKNMSNTKKISTPKGTSEIPKGIVTPRGNVASMRTTPINYKTRLCRHYESGKCKLSGLCNFAHGPEELAFYQQLGKADEKSRKSNEFSTPQKHETSLQKIENMEKQLEKFYVQQRTYFKNLKQFSSNLKLGQTKNEENLHQMEANIIGVYNSALSYTQEIGKIMEVSNLPSKSSEHMSYTDDQMKSQEPLENLEELNEEEAEYMKHQIYFMIKS